MKNKNMKTILHSHWDREWYFTVEETQMYLRYLVQNVFDYLEENPDVKFMFDGQSVMLDDMSKYFEDTDKYREILNKQILLGPWYTQTDLRLPTGESIVRNLMYGLNVARKYTDKPMLIGYAPDTFGHNPQMPQIYNQFGIDSTVFWRGYSKQMAKSNVFDWVGIDGSEVKAISLAAGYQGAKYLPENGEELKDRIDTVIKKYEKFGTQDKILLMNGHDQMPIQKNIKSIINNVQQIYPEYEVEISDLESYVNQFLDENGEKVFGYLNHGDFTRVHRTIGSTRMDIKIENRELEKTIYEILEPLSLIAEKYNIRYPNLLIEHSLKELMGAHAHDSLGGCNTDEVNADIKHRLSRVKRLVQNHIHITKRAISSSITKDNNICIYNMLPYTVKNEIVEVELLLDNKDFMIKDLNGNILDYDILSSETINMKDIDRQVLAKMLDIYREKIIILVKVPEIKGLDVLELKIEENHVEKSYENLEVTYIEDDFYKIDIENDQINLKLKKQNVVIDNFISIENSGDDGDSYDYSPPRKDLVIGNDTFDSVEILSVYKRALFNEINLKATNNLPYNLKDRENSKLNTKQEYLIKIRLFNDSDIKVNIKLINNTIDQRTRVKIKSKNEIDVIKAGCQFGFIDIENDFDLEKLSVDEKWVEKAVNIFNFQDKLIHNDNLSISCDSLNEFEYTEDKIYLTLFRSFSYMGKSDLINRPNRASGMNLPTPEAKLEGVEFEFDFKLNYVNQNLEFDRTKLISYQNKEFNRFNININSIGKQDSSLYLPLEKVNISAIKKSDKNDGIILRIFNTDKETNIVFDDNIILCDIEENEIKEIKDLNIKTNEIKTIKIK
ncbi:glycosyl hydrolase-related protein [Helcococcus kunzii]|uniref:glycoside hydrolase family 38 N-terminal domain-containing protein n=1 Tax=Helcococcus kunzii TaxID=40091 RepID=UPI0024AE23FC|nr:glycosyl hydrolase-related protein [Helcococcus kunzii]